MHKAKDCPEFKHSGKHYLQRLSAPCVVPCCEACPYPVPERDPNARSSDQPFPLYGEDQYWNPSKGPKNPLPELPAKEAR